MAMGDTIRSKMSTPFAVCSDSVMTIALTGI
jgi:hypothetical protein